MFYTARFERHSLLFAPLKLSMDVIRGGTGGRGAPPSCHDTLGDASFRDPKHIMPTFPSNFYFNSPPSTLSFSSTLS